MTSAACRSPKDYFAVVDSLENQEADGRYSHFELISCKCVDTYVRVKKNQSQICWKWKKVSRRLHFMSCCSKGRTVQEHCMLTTTDKSMLNTDAV